MTKRVLAFLMVIAMVFSLIPTVVVAEEAETPAAYEVIIQKAHNQTSADGVDVDIYLQAAAAAEVTAFQVTFDKVLNVVATEDGVQGTAVNVDAEGNEIPADDTTTEVAGEATKLVYPPEEAAIAVDTGRTLLATVNAATLAEVAISYVEVTVEGGYYANVAGTAEDGYLGEAAVEALPYACDGHDCGHGEGTWVEFTATAGELAAGNYYLTSDVQLTGALDVAADAEVTICLNGYDITAADGKRIFELTKAGATLNICDCTAEGEGAAYTAGKLLPKHNQGGALRSIAAENVTINFYGGIIDGTNSNKKEASVALIRGSTLNMLGGKVENFDAGLLSSGNHYGPIIVRGKADGADGVATIADVTFVNCGSAVMSGAPGDGDRANGAVLTVEDVTVLDSASGAYAIEIKADRFKSVTLKGDCDFDAPVYVEEGETVTLALGQNADVNIVTEAELTEEQFNEQFKMAEGGSLTDGTLLYETNGVFVTYDAETGLFAFQEGHTIDDKHAAGIVFKAWDKTDSLPTEEGNWYLLDNVTVSATATLQSSNVVNLDLNGHTVTTTGPRFFDIYVATLNLFDGTSTFDDEGNWTAAGTGKITGATGGRGAIRVWAGGTFNLYSGTLSGNGRDVKDFLAGAVYVSTYESGRATQPGAVFNMYGGEITGNKAGRYGAAIAAFTDSTEIPETHTPAQINISGGKIYENTTVVSGDTDTQGVGTIYAENACAITVTGGEFLNNQAKNGGVFTLSGSSTLNISGGKFIGNSALNAGGVALVCPSGTPTEAVFTVTGGEFTDNSANMGGVFYIENDAIASISGTAEKPLVLNSNDAKDGSNNQGGALYIVDNADVTAEYVDFTENTAASAGVAYVGGDSSITFINCRMTGNTTTSNGSAIRTGGNCVVTLDDTLITGNNSGGGVWACGALYHTGAGQKVILSGATVIVGNTGGTEGTTNPLSQDYVFQGNNATPTVYVNELSAGAHVNMYSLSADNRAATDLVQIAEGGSQTDWDCGWLTYYESTGAGTTSTYTADVEAKSISRLEGVFTFGHYHKDAEGNLIKLDPWTSTTAPTTAGNYYLTKDLKLTQNWTPPSGTTICFNGHKLYSNNSSAKFSAITTKAADNATLTLMDCTATYDADGFLISGGKMEGFYRSGNGTAIVNTGTTYATSTYISGIEFVNCEDSQDTASLGYGGGVIHMRGSNSLYVDGCKFTDNTTLSGGGAIQIFGTSGKTKTVEIKNTLFVNNSSGHNGGAISLAGVSSSTDTALIENCKFEGNSTTTYVKAGATEGSANSGRGGAIFVNKFTADIKNCDFVNNSTTYNTALDPVLTNNAQGGAIYVGYSSKITLDDNCTFTGNHADQFGGAVFTYAATTYKGTYKGNSAGTSGGAINQYDAAATVNGATFEANTATYGGAIYNNKGLTVDGATFKNNEATSRGGAVYSPLTATATNTYRNNCVFEGNKAVGDMGGAIYAQPGSGYTLTLNISDSTFKSNTTKTNGAAYGGAIASRGVTKTTLTDSIFDSNASYYGGVYWSESSSSQLQATGCTFQNNNAKALGGALCLAWANNANTLTNCQFLNNHCDAVKLNAAAADKYDIAGGAIFSGGTSSYKLTIDGCTFTGNTTPGNGGAIGAGSGPNATANTPTVEIKNSTFTQNSGRIGGAVSACKGPGASYGGDSGNIGAATVNITNSTFEQNIATAAGAAVGIAGTSTVTMTDCTVQNNTDQSSFGAVYLQNDNAFLTLSGKTIIKDNPNKNYEQANLFMRGDTDPNPYVTFSELHPESVIGINATNARYNNEPVLSKVPVTVSADFGDNDLNKCFFSGDERRFITHIATEVNASDVIEVGDLFLTNYVDESGNAYDTMQEAVNNTTGDTFVVQAGNRIEGNAEGAQPITLPATVTTLDLNGKTVTEVTVTGSEPLKLVDSKSDFNTPADQIGKVKINGEYESEFTEDGKRYVVVEDDEGYASVHRVHLVLSHRLLRPATFGAGFKANFYADEVLSEKVTYGVLFSFYEDAEGSDFETEGPTYWFAADFYEMAPGYENGVKPNQKVLAVTNLLTDGEDNMWDKPLYGVPFVNVGGTITHEEIDGKMHSRISGGTTLYGTKQTVNMKTLAENAFRSGDDTVAKKVADMLIAKGLDGSVFDN